MNGMKTLQRLILAIAAIGCLAPAAALELKIASVAPDGSAWMREMRAGAQRISTATEGRVVLKFYPGGVMGDDSQILRRIRVGQLHGGALAAGGLGDRYPALKAYGVPLLFRSLDEVDYVRTKFDSQLRAGLEDAGFVSFGFVEGGFAQFMSTDPVRSVEDLRRRKVWIPDGDQISLLALETLGISPVPLPVTDVMTSLQTGLLDVVASSPGVALVLQWHTKVQYVTDLPVAYSFGIMAIDARVFDRIADSDQRIVREVMNEVMTSLDAAAREDNAEALQAMFKVGIESVAVDSSSLDAWRAAVQSIFPELRAREGYVDASFFDRMLAALAEYRGAAAPGSGP